MSRAVHILLIISAIVLFGCEEEARIPAPSDRPTLVVTCFISPGEERIAATVFETKPFYGVRKIDSTHLDYSIVKDARVYISQGNEKALLLYDDFYQSYTISAKLFKILPGLKYQLTVTVPDGRKAEASCTVLEESNSTLEVRFDTLPKQYYYNRQVHKMYFSWQDNSPGQNFYRVEGSAKYGLTKNSVGVPIVEFAKSPMRMDEESSNGAFNFWGYILLNNVYNKDSLLVQGYSAYLYVVDEHYYKYFKSLEEQDKTKNNPFAEPALIYSNVVGGIGVFASYSKCERKWEH